MKTVLEILRSKSIQDVYTVPPDTSALEAAQLLATLNIGALLVTYADDIVGIISERDYVRKLADRGNALDELTVRDLMNSPVMYVEPTMNNEECMAVMTENRLRHLPVVEDGHLLGVISIGDLVKDIIGEQRFVIEQLEHYISGALA